MIHIDPHTGVLDYVVGFDRGTLATAPATPDEGWVYYNSGDSKYYIFYGKVWREFIVLANYILMENGDKLLLETGDKLVLEQ